MSPLVTSLIIIGIAFGAILTGAAYAVYFERKISAWIQQRPGPNRVGPLGLLQPLADVIKLLLKEDIIPEAGDKFIHFLAPIISTGIALSTFAVIPFSNEIYIADVNIGILFILAATSIGVYGITLAGWSSNSKYALLGGMRSSAQMISYELSMGISVVGVILLTNAIAPTGSDMLSLRTIVEAQYNGVWFCFVNPIGMFVFITCAFAETNRSPFDLVEAEQELVGGFHTEYSSMKFALFFLAEYINLLIASMIITTLFFGGYSGIGESFAREASWWDNDILRNLWGIGWFTLKTLGFAGVFIWVRWTLPRFKYNQLMDIGWKKFLPLSIINLMLLAIGIYLYLNYV